LILLCFLFSDLFPPVGSLQFLDLWSVIPLSGGWRLRGEGGRCQLCGRAAGEGLLLAGWRDLERGNAGGGSSRWDWEKTGKKTAGAKI
jgi:hypothetical protein